MPDTVLGAGNAAVAGQMGSLCSRSVYSPGGSRTADRFTSIRERIVVRAQRAADWVIREGLSNERTSRLIPEASEVCPRQREQRVPRPQEGPS